MEIRLLVLRTSDMKKLAEFYSFPGVTLEYHKHGNSPYHYSAVIGKAVLEIYPLSKNQAEADKNLRLGFEVDDFETTLATLREKQIAVSDPTQTDFGFMAIVTDSDGRKVELYKK